jgi:hypothetical protein
MRTPALALFASPVLLSLAVACGGKTSTTDTASAANGGATSSAAGAAGAAGDGTKPAAGSDGAPASAGGPGTSGSGGGAGAAGAAAGAAGAGGGSPALLCSATACPSDPDCPAQRPQLSTSCSASGLCNYCDAGAIETLGCVFGDHWEPVAGGCALSPKCAQKAALTLSAPTIDDVGGDGTWSPGESATVSVTMTNDSATDDFDYPSVTFTSNHPGVTTVMPQGSLFGIVAGMSSKLQAGFTAEASIPTGTVVTLTATISTIGMLTCPTWNSLSFDVTLK